MARPVKAGRQKGRQTLTRWASTRSPLSPRRRTSVDFLSYSAVVSSPPKSRGASNVSLTAILERGYYAAGMTVEWSAAIQSRPIGNTCHTLLLTLSTNVSIRATFQISQRMDGRTDGRPNSQFRTVCCSGAVALTRASSEIARSCCFFGAKLTATATAK